MRTIPFTNMPCGCDTRRDIMFHTGDVSYKTAALFVAAIAATLYIAKGAK